jgi:hypothetical protein
MSTDLEQIIKTLIWRKRTARGAELQLIERELRGLRYSYETAGGIIEDLDPIGWGSYCRPLPAAPATDTQPIQLHRRPGSHDE